MRFFLKGRLCATLCDDCRDPLSRVTVRLSSQAVAEPGVAELPATPAFSLLDVADVEAKRSRQVCEIRTDEDGYFYAEIEDDHYQGQPLEIDVVQIASRGASRPVGAEVVLHVGLWQPFWRESAGCYLAAWAQCLPRHVWCMVRGMTGRRELVGHVREVNGGQFVAGVRVALYSDQAPEKVLAEAGTDSRGRFIFRCNATELRRYRECATGEVGAEGLFFKVSTPVDVPGAQAWQVTRLHWCSTRQICAATSSLCVDLDVERSLEFVPGMGSISILPKRLEELEVTSPGLVAGL